MFMMSQSELSEEESARSILAECLQPVPFVTWLSQRLGNEERIAMWEISPSRALYAYIGHRLSLRNVAQGVLELIVIDTKELALYDKEPRISDKSRVANDSEPAPYVLGLLGKYYPLPRWCQVFLTLDRSAQYTVHELIQFLTCTE